MTEPRLWFSLDHNGASVWMNLGPNWHMTHRRRSFGCTYEKSPRGHVKIKKQIAFLHELEKAIGNTKKDRRGQGRSETYEEERGGKDKKSLRTCSIKQTGCTKSNAKR